jgi:hypothetical protein
MATIALPLSASALPAKSAGEAKDQWSDGLTSNEARLRQKEFGPNAMPDAALHPFGMAYAGALVRRGQATAGIVAHAVGLDGAVSPGPIPDSVRPAQFAVFAGVLPGDKHKLVKAFQTSGHTVGMCGDGTNDAPALRQAQMGIAVSTASDVAKSAAGMVLTDPGLAGIVAAVKEGRVTFQRILSYTLNSITKRRCRCCSWPSASS